MATSIKQFTSGQTNITELGNATVGDLVKILSKVSPNLPLSVHGSFQLPFLQCGPDSSYSLAMQLKSQ